MLNISIIHRSKLDGLGERTTFTSIFSINHKCDRIHGFIHIWLTEFNPGNEHGEGTTGLDGEAYDWTQIIGAIPFYIRGGPRLFETELWGIDVACQVIVDNIQINIHMRGDYHLEYI